MAPFSKEQAQRYARQFALREIGCAGQEKLRAGRVLVVGAGGLGSTALYYLAAAGVGTLGIADGDCVDRTNLNRQILHNDARLGQNKAESAAETLRAFCPDLTLRCFPFRVTPDNLPDLLPPYDLLLDCTDRFETKFLLNDACVLAGKPFVHAGAVRFEGQAMTCIPGKSPCLRCVLGEVPAGETCASVGVLGAIPGLLGCVQATEAVKLLLGEGELLTGRVLHVDGLTMRMQTVRVETREDCPVCGAHPTIRSLTDDRAAYEPCGTI